MAKTEVVPWHGMREAPIVLVTGSEQYLADRVFRELRDRVRGAQPELEVTDIDAAGYAAGTLLDVASPSLFGEPRMIRISNGESGGDEFLSDVQSYLDVVADDVIVIVRHGGGNRGSGRTSRLLRYFRCLAGHGTEPPATTNVPDGDGATQCGQC